MEQMSCLIAALCTFFTFLCTCSAQEAYQTEALRLHNQYRQKHHAPPLQIDKELNALAVKCAQYYVKLRKIDHTCPYKKDAGENLADWEGANWNAIQFAEAATKMWYDEVKFYDYSRPGFSPRTGHFTEVVWKNTKNFGFGYFQSNGFTVAVGLYVPAGNFLSQFPQNVLRP